MGQLQAVIDCSAPEHSPCDPEHLNKALMGMMAVLPRQGKDATTGALMVEQYIRKLGNHPKGAIDYLWSKSIDRLKWFPTIAECNEIVAEWMLRAKTIVHAKSIASSKIRHENDLRFRDMVDRLRARQVEQGAVAGLPDAVKRQAVEQGYLWLLKDGTYLIRPDTIDMDDDQKEAHRMRVAKLREDGLL